MWMWISFPVIKWTVPPAIQSAVDRTPFHTRYITERINGLIDDVLLLKQFTKAGGIYGSDQMTEGFSGYLCESAYTPLRGFTPLIEGSGETGARELLLILNSMQQKNLMSPLS